MSTSNDAVEACAAAPVDACAAAFAVWPCGATAAGALTVAVAAHHHLELRVELLLRGREPLLLGREPLLLGRLTALLALDVHHPLHELLAHALDGRLHAAQVGEDGIDLLVVLQDLVVLVDEHRRLGLRGRQLVQLRLQLLARLALLRTRRTMVTAPWSPYRGGPRFVSARCGGVWHRSRRARMRRSEVKVRTRRRSSARRA
eukprot:6051335-Prymnesium_polylepis.1